MPVTRTTRRARAMCRFGGMFIGGMQASKKIDILLYLLDFLYPIHKQLQGQTCHRKVFFAAKGLAALLKLWLVGRIHEAMT